MLLDGWAGESRLLFGQAAPQSGLSKEPGSRVLPNGIEVRNARAALWVVALRDDVLRIRMSAKGALPEDVSWAVLPQSRTASIAVRQSDPGKTIGFSTKSLKVEIQASTLRLRILDLAGNVLQEDAGDWTAQFNGDAFRIYKSMPADEHYFGLGDKTGPLDRRNQAFTMWNTDAYNFQESTDPLYKSIPFFIAMRQGRAIGVLFDNTWRTSFDFGRTTAGVYSFGSENGPIEYYVLYGPEPKQVLSAYAWLTGPTPLPPLWVFGYQQSRYSYMTGAELREVATKLREHRIPTDGLYLDIDFQYKNRPFTIDEKTFPNFAAMVKDLNNQNVRVVAITDMHIGHAPGEKYAAYESGVAGDHFIKNPDGSPFVGQVWPGPSVFPDFTRQSTREWWGGLYKDLLSDGVAGFWNDMNEPAVFKIQGGTMPLDTRHRIELPGFQKRTTTHREIHNIYGLENSRATYEGLLKLAPNQRPFVLTRATYAGGHRYAATWTGDNGSSWNHLRMTTPMILNLGLSGFALNGADVGGFIGSPSADLLTKWFEFGAFQPIDRDHTEKGTAPQEPWVHGPAHEDIRRKYIEERYRLMPYLYTVAEEMSRTGWPIMRPLFFEYPQVLVEGRPVDLSAGGQFLFGPDLLVAPPAFPEKVDKYPVVLPATGWYDYWTGERVKGTVAAETPQVQRVIVEPSLETLPVYVREGAILPMQAVVQSTQEVPKGPLTLRVYPGPDCRGSLYQDDGQTMDYKQGEFLRMTFTCQATADSIRVRASKREGTHPAWWKQVRLEIFGWTGASVRATLNGAEVPNATADPSRHAAIVDVPEDGDGFEVELKAAQ